MNKVLIQNNQTDNGCWSYVGNQQNGTQLLELSDWCFTNKTTPHELLHAVGIYHEQARPDRDQYVEINLNCVQPGNENNYRKQKSSLTYDLPYNPKSIMHYPSGVPSCKTITSKVHCSSGKYKGYKPVFDSNDVFCSRSKAYLTVS